MEEIFNSYFDNRELSWLKFNKRVLEEAQDDAVPLMERLNFVSIFCSNLDEFFMVRVGTLHDQTLLKESKRDNKTGLTAAEQLEKIAESTKELLPQVEKAYKKIMKQLLASGVEQVNPHNMDKDDEKYLRDYFLREVLPLLSPTIIDKNHPVPFLKNKELYVGLILKQKSDSKNNVIGIIPVTAAGIFERVIYLPTKTGVQFILIEDLIMHFAHLAFKDFEIQHRYIFRVTRNADIDVNEALFDHDLDFRDVMEEVIKKRKKLAPVRIEISDTLDDGYIEYLSQKLGLELGVRFVFSENRPLDFGFVGQLRDKLETQKELFFEPLTPQHPVMIDDKEPMIKQIERHDILLAYPYEEFKPFIRLLEEASEDQTVASIKITLYRVARDSKIVNALIRAAENGKDVLALVELRARFDEENNIGWAKRLAEAGVTVIYGLDELKVHSKLLLITKRAGNEIKYITQVGTGNYNERTSKLYTDMTLMTADMEMGADASLVFNNLSVGTAVESSTTLWVAPNCLKSRVVEMIDREITYGEDGYIGLKLNSLTDRDIIQKLVQANKCGVKVQLIIRGICCLVAGIPGETENITVTSIVGRFLEHSRIYIFGKDERQKLFISSADFMTRNTERRVEVAAPIRDHAIKERLLDYFNTILKDNAKARVQGSDGIYRKKQREAGAEPLDSQVYFYRQAYKNAEEKLASSKQKKGFFAKLKEKFGK